MRRKRWLKRKRNQSKKELTGGTTSEAKLEKSDTKEKKAVAKKKITKTVDSVKSK